MGMFDNQFFHKIYENGVEKVNSPQALDFVGVGVDVSTNISTGRTEVAITGASSAPRIPRITADASTVALYHFDGDLNDSGANAINLSGLTGTTQYTDLVPGHRCLLQRAETPDRHQTASGTALALTGNMTVEFLININASAVLASNNIVYYWNDTAGGSTNNSLWGIELSNTTQDIRWFSHSGSFVLSEYVLNGFSIPNNITSYFAATRTANVIQFYLNGLPIGAASSALTTPDGGSGSRMRLGGATHNAMHISELCISNVARSAAFIKARYNTLLGGLLGSIA